MDYFINNQPFMDKISKTQEKQTKIKPVALGKVKLACKNYNYFSEST